MHSFILARIHTQTLTHARSHATTLPQAISDARASTRTNYLANTVTTARTHVHVCMHMHTCTRAHMHTCTHAHMHTCTHAHMHRSTRAHMKTCTEAHVHAHTYIHTLPHRPIWRTWSSRLFFVYVFIQLLARSVLRCDCERACRIETVSSRPSCDRRGQTELKLLVQLYLRLTHNSLHGKTT